MSTQLESTRNLSNTELQYIQGLQKICAPKGNRDFAPFANLDDGQTRTFYFDPSQNGTRVQEFKSKWTETGKVTKICFDVEDPESGEKFTLALAKTFASPILDELAKGNVMLDVERIGEGTRTNYRVKPSQ